MKGKSILSIPTSSANPFTAGIELNFEAIAKQLGFKFQAYTNEGQPSQWVSGVDYGVTGKFNLIDLLAGTNPEVLEPQIEAAERAGIKVVSSHVTGMGKWNKMPAVTANVPINYEQVGQFLADYAMLQTGGHANVLVIESAELPSTLPEVTGIQEQFKKYDPHYQLKLVNSPIPEWSQKVAPEVEAWLAADPTGNYILPIYDSMDEFIIPALRAEHKLGKIGIATYNGTPFVLGYIQQGWVTMDIGENLNWIAHGILDDEMRLLCGQKFVTNEHIPDLIFTKANAKSAGVPPQYSKGYGSTYIQDYNTLWGS